MQTKPLFDQGNLYSGYPYGVHVEKQFGTSEYHGPFGTENEAWNYGMELAQARKPFDQFVTISVVKIETPHVRTITTAEAVKEARETGLIK